MASQFLKLYHGGEEDELCSEAGVSQEQVDVALKP